MPLWLVRAGRDNELVTTALNNEVCAVNFHEVRTDLSVITSQEALAAIMKAGDLNARDQRIIGRVAELWKFAKVMAINDVILMPVPRAKVYVGTVMGDYQYVPSLVASPHTRPVKWRKEVARSRIPAEIMNHLSNMAVNLIRYDETKLRILLGV